MINYSLLCIQVSCVFLSITIAEQVTGCYTSIFAFGDSLSDNGNLVIFSAPKNIHQANLPNGETYFHHPSGRCCDGRLIIDLLAQRFGLPMPLAFAGIKKANRSEIQKGVNFAVSGARVLNTSFYEKLGIMDSDTNASLSVQLNWFKDLLPSICGSKADCRGKLKSSVVLFGPIGENDYRYTLFERTTSLQELKLLAHPVTDAIVSALTELIEIGVGTVIVPGLIPDGCMAWSLIKYGSGKIKDYDPSTGCLIWMNDFAEYHNGLLQMKLDLARERYPSATSIIYADYYNAIIPVYRNPEQYGFKHAKVACCGGGGPLNVNLSVSCGDPITSSACSDPSLYVEWDGVHFTEAGNKFITSAILEGPYTIPHIDTSCLRESESLSSIVRREGWI